MSPSRLLPLVLMTAAALASACSTDTNDPGGETLDAGDGDGDGPGKTDATVGDGDGDGDGDASSDAGDGDGVVDSGLDSGGPCVPLGCSELGFTCGLAKDNCGGDLNCEPSTGDPCEGFETCGGDATKPNTCGCTPKTCAELGGACGTDVPDGCGGTVASCGEGNCLSQGDNYICAVDRSACQCVPRPESVVCAQHGCGSYSNDCDATIPCGTCTGNKTCVESGGGASSACECDLNNATKKALACGNKTCGTATTADGCIFTCGDPCVASCGQNGNCATSQNCSCPNDGPAGPGIDQVCHQNVCCTVPANAAAACGSQQCGEVTKCGVTFKCGNNGQCTDNTLGCSMPAAAGGYNKAVSVPTCIDKRKADLLGTYRVRTHAFRASGANAVINRSEALSLVTIEINAANQLRMRDYGCYTTGIDINGKNPSIAPSYYNLPELNVALEVPDDETVPALPSNSSTWLRPASSIAAGFINERPGSYFCDAAGAPTKVGADYDTTNGFVGPAVTPSSGSKKEWLEDTQVCTCPANTVSAYSALPTENTGSSDNGVTDCRINDVDDDDKPGFTVIAKYNNTTLNVTAASVSTTEWWGTIDPAGRHYGFAAISDNRDRKTPLSRKFLSCSGDPAIQAAFLCLGGSGAEDWGCGDQYDLVLFEKLPAGTRFNTFDQLKAACTSVYYSQVPATAVGQASNPTEFSSPTTCSTYAQCRGDEICRAGKCWPMTSPGGCDKVTAPCRPGWQCADSDHSCWPATCSDPTP